MERIIKAMTAEHRADALDFVEHVFTDHCNADEGKEVRALVEEIRSKKYYIPELELIMVDESDEIIGYAMFSRFHIEGRYDRELLLLSPVAVKPELQRQHISREMIEFGFERARSLGYKAVMVEGDPRNYHSRGFETSARHGIVAGPGIHLPHVDCLMVAALVPGGLEAMHGVVDYGMYETLCPPEA